MSEEDFLRRWSRRKRAATQGKLAPEATETAEPQAEVLSPVTESAADESRREQAPEFDLSKLPSLDQITATTDIRVFMQPGVPSALRRAALRRAWSADPAIRDFVGLSENSWDFTDPNSIAGFGALDPAEVPKLLANFLNSVAPQPEQQRRSETEAGERQLPPEKDLAQEHAASQLVTISERPADLSDALQCNESDPAQQQSDVAEQKGQRANEERAGARIHGRALPK